MKLTAISFENYKAFPKRESMELRPLTVLIGRNSSGKSVIARLPLLLARALSERAEAPLELEFDGLDFGASFVDLIHKRFLHGAIGVGATFADDSGHTHGFQVKLQHFDEPKMLLASCFEYFSDSPIILEWSGQDPLRDAENYHFVTTGQECKVSFRKIFPSDIQLQEKQSAVAAVPSASGMPGTGSLAPMIQRLEKAGKAFSAAMERITYLGPFREPPQRKYLFPGASPKNVGSAGERASALLGDDFLRRRGRVVDSVGDWFARCLGGWPLDVSRQGDGFSLVLRNPDDPSIEINIVDVGIGISQVLPIVVQRQFEAISGNHGNIEIVEQPELHLHPRAHTELADLYVTALQQTNTRFLIETHSENFLLRIRRRVAEGGLDPDKVIIYWVNDEPDASKCIQPIHIDRDGAVDSWPEGVFSEDFEEARGIRMARKGKNR